MKIENDIQNVPVVQGEAVRTLDSDAPVPVSTGAPSDTADREGHGNWRDNFNVVIAVIGVVIIGFQGWIMYRQTGLMTKQTSLMDQTLRVSERAYVGIESLKADWEAREVVIMLQNIGNVPAKAIKLQAEEIRATPSTELATGSKVYEKLDGSTFPWGAGAVQLFPGTPMRVAIPLRDFKPEEVDAILKKQENLYVFGRIEYEDGFGGRDSTVFAFEYSPPQPDGWTAHSDLSQVFKQK